MALYKLLLLYTTLWHLFDYKDVVDCCLLHEFAERYMYRKSYFDLFGRFIAVYYGLISMKCGHCVFAIPWENLCFRPASGVQTTWLLVGKGNWKDILYILLIWCDPCREIHSCTDCICHKTIKGCIQQSCLAVGQRQQIKTTGCEIDYLIRGLQ